MEWDVSSICLKDFYAGGQIAIHNAQRTIQMKSVFIGMGYNVSFIRDTVLDHNGMRIQIDDGSLMQVRCVLQCFLIQRRNKIKNFLKRG